VIILKLLLQPALLFNFDRTDCEILARDLLQALQSAEDEWRKNNTSWTRKVRDWEAWKSRAKERERLADKAKKMKKDADSPAVPPQEHSWESTFDPDDPSPQFSFAGSHTSYSLADLEKDIEGMRWNTSIQQWAFDALRRGIAVHHSGMNKQYRSLVERCVIYAVLVSP
jgi:ATP-dependent RNA helicase DDX60